MPSIRRSLLGYLLLLLALALGAVGVFVDRFANGAIRQREESEEERIEQAMKLREHEARAKFDADLLKETKDRAREVQRTVALLLQQNWEQRPRPAGGGPGGPGGAGGFGPGGFAAGLPQPQPPARASEAEANEYRLRTELFVIGAPLSLPNAVAFAAVQSRADVSPQSRRYYPFPGWTEFDAPRVPGRIADALHKALEDEHAGYFQYTFVGTYPNTSPNRPNRTIAVASTGAPGTELPLDAAWLGPDRDHEPKIEDADVPGKGKCRVVTTGSGSGRLFFVVVLPSPPAPPANAPVLQPASRFPYPVFQPWRGPDVYLRVFVHHARPYSELDARLAPFQKEHDDQLARVRAETQAELAQLRARLIAIGTATFAALVLGGWFIVARGLAPLRKLSDAVSRVSERDFHLTVEPTELGHELAPIHARLKQTLTLLQRAFAREKQAVADISHELRTPIAALLATIDVALRKPRTPDQYRTALEECRLISKQLGQLVERIMTLASLDAGNDHTNVARTDAVELAGGCAAVIRPLAAANNLTVTTHFDEELVFDTDAGKLREVLMNLLHNAVEYNKPGGTIDLTLKRDGATAVFEVRDTGIGMTAEVKDKIFERFYRADASRQATGVHAGLGLAIVKEYVARLGGAIVVESEPGVGTTFRVTLPLTASAPAVEAPKPPAAQSDRTKPRDTVAASS